uniref:Ig-like domain-containing protein n=1 Tax=Anas zonorhyncha TaxID=75864 RepID=A0A8B9U4L6_9AVES
MVMHRPSSLCALEVDGAEGGSVTFHLQDLKGEKLGWSFNGDTMLTITLGKSLNPSFFDDSYKSRVTIPDDGSSLTISQLKKKDAGTYTAKNPVYRANFTLRVHSVLQEPEVTCVSRNCSAKGCRYVLRCAVHTPEITSFSWSHGEQLDAEEPELVVEEEQPPGELDVLSYTCTVQNPVSSRNVTVLPATICTGESPQRMQGWGPGDAGGDGMHPDPSRVPLRLSETALLSPGSDAGKRPMSFRMCPNDSSVIAGPSSLSRQQKLYRRHSRDGDHSADNPGWPLGLLDIPR